MKLKGIVCGAAVLALALSAQAALILEQYGTDATKYLNPNTAAEMEALTGDTGLTLLVKGGEGLFASSYSTDLGEKAATITYDGSGPVMTGGLWLFVKDGFGEELHSPYWYLFRITEWDGKETLTTGDLFPDRGAISYAAIWGGTGGFVPPDGTGVPDGGSTIILLGGGIVGLVSLRRRLA